MRCAVLSGHRGSVAAAVLVFGICLGTFVAQAAELRPHTTEAFDRYVKLAEARMDDELRVGHPFLWVDVLPEVTRKGSFAELHKGDILVQSRGRGVEVPGGLIHDWVAVTFISAATLDGTLALLQNYDRDDEIYAPEVLHSKLLQHEDDHFRVSLRLKKKSFATVVLDVVNDVQYFRLDAARAESHSYSIHISELENEGTSSERQRPPGNDHGYLWRLYTYWRFLEGDGGVYVQCEAIALSRGIPIGLGWLIKPYVTKIPKESLIFTLARTRDAVQAAARKNLDAGHPRTAEGER